MRKPRRTESNADPLSSCEGKRRYASFALAESGARATGRKVKKGMIFYRCRVCHGWHIGNPDLGQSRREKKPPPIVLDE